MIYEKRCPLTGGYRFFVEQAPVLLEMRLKLRRISETCDI